MRREDFRDSMMYMEDLFDFARENDLTCCDEVVPGGDLDSAICDDLREGEVTHHLRWDQIRDALEEIEEGCEFYIRGDGWLEYNELCYEDFFDSIMEEMDDNDLWDPDDEGEEDDEEDEEDSEDELDECHFSFEEFTSSVKDEAESIRERLIREEAEKREEEQRAMMETQRLIDEAQELAKRDEAHRTALLFASLFDARFS